MAHRSGRRKHKKLQSGVGVAIKNEGGATAVSRGGSRGGGGGSRAGGAKDVSDDSRDGERDDYESGRNVGATRRCLRYNRFRED